MTHYLFICPLLIGLALPVHCSFLLDAPYLVVFLCVSFLSIPLLVYLPKYAKWLRPIVILIISFCFSSLSLHKRIDSQLPSIYEGKNIKAVIQVIGLPTSESASSNYSSSSDSDTDFVLTRFDAVVLNVFAPSEKTKSIPTQHGTEMTELRQHQVALKSMENQRIRLSWRRPKGSPSIQAGEYWSLVLRLKRPRGLLNPSGFDFQAWLLGQGISARGYVLNKEANYIIQDKPFSIFNWRPLNDLRAAISANLFDHNTLPLMGLMRALVVGDKSKIPPEHWDTLIQTGTSHLMAISGLHIGLVAVFAFVLARHFLSLLTPAASILLLRAIPCFISVSSACLYAGVAGFSVATQRACFMVLIFNLVYLIGRRVNALDVLFYVAIIVLALNPFASYDNGFWLSFFAVLFLLVCFSQRPSSGNKIKSVLIAQLAVGVGLLVVLAFRQLPFSYMSPLVNIIAVPVVSIFVIPGVFIAACVSFISPKLGGIILEISHEILSWLWYLLEWFAQYQTYIWLPQPSLLIICVGLLGTLLLLTPYALGLKWLGVSLLLLCFFHRENSLPPEKITVLDVGQGLSIVAESQGRMMVYDFGAHFSPRFDIGSDVTAPFVRTSSKTEVDLAIVSHGDNDHAGGLKGFLDEVNIKTLWMNNNSDKSNKPVIGVIKQDKEKAVVDKNEPCITGQQYKVGHFSAEVIWPDGKSLSELSSNNRSCVVLLKYGNFSMLLAGDIERTVEEELLSLNRLPQNIDVLIAPHHGSKTSSSPRFIRHVSPKHVIFSAGFKNRYRHPAKQIRERYKRMEITQWNTATQGAITIDLSKDDMTGAVRFNNQKDNQETTTFNLYAEREIAWRPWFKEEGR